MNTIDDTLFERFKDDAVKLSIEAFNRGYQLGIEHARMLAQKGESDESD